MATGNFRTSYKNMTGSGQVIAGEGWLSGLHVNTTSSGTFAIYNGLTATGSVIYQGTPSAGADIDFKNTHFPVGCYVSVGGTSLNVTFQILEN